MSKIAKEKIEEWKRKYGEVFEVKIEGLVGYIRKPDRATLSAAAALGQADGVKYSEIMVTNCWLGGDDKMKEDDECFFALATRVAELFKVKESTLKKL